MKLRKIPHEAPKQIYRNAKERYWDIMTQHYIAIMSCFVNEKDRDMALSYDEKDRVVELITIHPIRQSQKLLRIKTGRWKKL
jgi:hypothetical protein